MSSLLEKLKFAFWFVKKGYFEQLFFMLNKSKKEKTREESTIWCKSIAVSEKEALKKLKIPYNDIQKDFSTFLSFAEKKQKECPFQMGGAGSVKVLYSFVKEIQPSKTIETGVAYGWSSLAILLGNKDNRNSHLWSVDMPYPNMNNDKFVGCVVHEDLKDKWSLIRKPDLKGLPIALESSGEIDFCHYDSDKSYRGRMKSSPLLWNKLKIGGYFMSDDINDNIAFKEFCEEINREPIVFEVNGKYVGIIKK